MASQCEKSAGVAQEPYCWTVHPARQRLGATMLAAMAIAGFAILCGIAADRWLALLALLVLAGSLNRFFLRSRFTIDAQGITADYPLRTQKLDWTDVRRFKRDRFGGFLSTRAVASRLDAYRGMHLLFGDSRDEEVRRIESYLAGGRQHDAKSSTPGTESQPCGDTSWAG